MKLFLCLFTAFLCIASETFSMEDTQIITTEVKKLKIPKEELEIMPINRARETIKAILHTAYALTLASSSMLMFLYLRKTIIRLKLLDQSNVLDVSSKFSAASLGFVTLLDSSIHRAAMAINCFGKIFRGYEYKPQKQIRPDEFHSCKI
jgi:hypothetical protein